MKNNKKYFQKFISSLLLLVFTYCAIVPAYANSALSGKTKTIQKESKAKNDQGDFVVEEELNDADDDFSTVVTLDVFHTFTLVFHSFVQLPSSQKASFKSYRTQALPLFITLGIFRV